MAAFTRADPADRAAFDALPRTGNDTASAGKARGTLDVSHWSAQRLYRSAIGRDPEPPTHDYNHPNQTLPRTTEAASRAQPTPACPPTHESVSDTCTTTVWCLNCADRDLLPGQHQHAGVGGPPLHGDRLSRRSGHRTGRTTALQRRGLAGLQRVGPGPQQLTRAGVEEQQRTAVFEIDPHPPTGQHPRRRHRARTQRDHPVLGDRALALAHRAAGTTARGPPRAATGGAPAATAPLATRASMSCALKRERNDSPGHRRSTVHPLPVDPEPHHLPGPRRARPELLATQPHVPRRRHHQIQLDRRTRPGLAGRVPGSEPVTHVG